MSAVSPELPFEAVVETAPASSVRRVRWVSRAWLALAWLPRIALNGALVGLLGLVLMLMWAPGHIQANEREQREWRRPPPDRSWWGRRDRDSRQWPARPERSPPRETPR